MEAKPGDTVSYKLTVKYTGDKGAKSGVIDVTDTLPEGVTPVADSIKIGSITYSDGTAGGYKGGKVTSAEFEGTTFKAQVEGLYAGTQVEISFQVKLSAVTPVSESDGYYQYWDNTANVSEAQGQLTSDSNTVRLWYKDTSYNPGGNNPGGGTGTTYYTITAEAGNGGSIDPDGRVSVARGSDKTFTITPGDGYKIKDVLVDDESVGAVESYTFEDVRKSHTIEVIFEAIEDEPEKPGIADPDNTGVSDWLNARDHIAYLNGYPDNSFGASRQHDPAQKLQRCSRTFCSTRT